MSHNVHESNILLCGSSRVGKSTLVNAICQENLSKSNQSLSSNTKELEQYSFESSYNNIKHKTIFWDTPGIESWNEHDIQNYMNSLIDKTQPLCMIYCASPGSFALLNHLVWIIKECEKKNIFCALVCTNMWSGRNRQMVVDEFCKILTIAYPTIQPNKEDGIIYYDNVALVTMVNSIEYIDEDFDVIKPQSGIDELIFGIGKCLKKDFMFSWLKTVSHNKSFWTKMSSKLNGLFHVPYETFNTFCQHADKFLEYIFTFDDYDYQYTRNTNDNDTDKPLFHDAVELHMPEDTRTNKLQFMVRSTELAAQLADVLSKLGAVGSNAAGSGTNNEEIIITAKFDDAETLSAVHDLCQIITFGQVNCTIVN